jgi:hypothetical protein
MVRTRICCFGCLANTQNASRLGEDPDLISYRKNQGCTMSLAHLPTQLPPNVKDLLKGYVGKFRLQELPASFTNRNASGLRMTIQGVPITYKHRDTGEILQVDTYPWKSADKLQSVVVASGKSLSKPVIIVPAQKGSSELKIWRGKNNNDDDGSGCPIYKEFGRRPVGHAGMRL